MSDLRKQTKMHELPREVSFALLYEISCVVVYMSHISPVLNEKPYDYRVIYSNSIEIKMATRKSSKFMRILLF